MEELWFFTKKLFVIFFLLFSRISDRGGGIPHHQVDQVLEYNFSTAEDSTEQLMDDNLFGNFTQALNQTTSGPMHGSV